MPIVTNGDHVPLNTLQVPGLFQPMLASGLQAVDACVASKACTRLCADKCVRGVCKDCDENKDSMCKQNVGVLGPTCFTELIFLVYALQAQCKDMQKKSGKYPDNEGDAALLLCEVIEVWLKESQVHLEKHGRTIELYVPLFLQLQAGLQYFQTIKAREGEQATLEGKINKLNAYIAQFRKQFDHTNTLQKMQDEYNAIKLLKIDADFN